jgi:hypothetical protein
MIDPLSCVRYITSEEIELTSQKLISWLSDSYPEISLIHQETLIDRGLVTTQLTFVHRYWGAVVKMEILPIDSNQTLILISAPPDPGLEGASHYAERILEHLPASSASIRLAWADGDEEKVSALIRNVLREKRHHFWMQFHSGLLHSFRLEPYDGNLEELSRDIPNDGQDMEPTDFSPSQDEKLVLDLWGRGYTAKQIALRMGRTEKTILNRLTLMRKTYGDQLVPRRRMA